MPRIEKHVGISMQRCGKPYREVHEWIDDPENENERHDITRVLEFSKMFEEKYGEEAARELRAAPGGRSQWQVQAFGGECPGACG